MKKKNKVFKQAQVHLHLYKCLRMCKEYGFQTCKFTFHNVSMFENDVKEYDFQTLYSMSKSKLLFENDVKMYSNPGIPRIHCKNTTIGDFLEGLY